MSTTITDGTIHDALRRAEASFGRDATLFHYVDADLPLTVGKLDERATTWARALVAAGIRVGDRVAVCLPGDVRWPVLQLACSRIGALFVGINTRYRLVELQQVLSRARPSVLVTMHEWRGIGFARMVREVLGDAPDGPVRTALISTDFTDVAGFTTEATFLAAGDAVDPDEIATRSAAVRPEDTAIVQFTSGSTAAPKGAALSHRSVLHTASLITAAAGFGPGDRVYSALPCYHIGGSVCTSVGALASGACMVVPETFDADASLEHIIVHRCTGQQGHPAMFQMQIDAARRRALDVPAASFLRKGWIASSGDIVRRLGTDLGMTEVVPVYGMSEYGLVAAGHHTDPLDKRASTIGRPSAGTEVRLVGEQDGVGEIRVRGPGAQSGYLGDDGGLVDGPAENDGWVSTGDLGRWDSEGYLVFVGREKDMIKPGGENVSALEVEEFLRSHPAVLHAAVVGVADDRLGEVPAAVVQGREGAGLSEEELMGYCDERIANFKRPRRLVVVDELPLLPNGKIDKRAAARLLGG